MIRLSIHILVSLIVAGTALAGGFEKAAGSFQLRTSAGSQSITTLAFQPKVIFFRWSDQTTTGATAANYSIGYGVAVSSSSRAAVFVRTNDGGLNADGRHANDRCIVTVNASGVISEAADLVSMNVNGFTINVTNASNAIRVSYEAWGGPSLTNIALVQFTTPTSTGNRPITGAGFAPDLAQFFTLGHTTAPPSATTWGRFGFGFASSSTLEAGLGNSVLTTSANETSAQSVSKALYVPDTSAMYLQADVVSFDSNGVTLNYTTVQSSPVYCWAIFTKGLQATVGSFTQPTTTGAMTVPLPFQPEATIFASFCNAAATGQQAGGKVSLGFAVSAAQQSVDWAGANSGNNQAQQASFTDAAIACYVAGSAQTPTLNTKADFVSNDPSGLKVNFSAVDATRRQVLYLSVAEAPGTEVIAPLLISQALSAP